MVSTISILFFKELEELCLLIFFKLEHRVKNYDLKKRYYSLPSKYKSVVEPIFEFLNYSFVYKYFYKRSKDLKSIKDAKRSIENGGMVFQSDTNQYSTRHKNLLDFVHHNKIMIENSEAFLKLNKIFVEIALDRQVQREVIELSKIELFSSIKYIKTKELKLLFDSYYGENSKNKGKFSLTKEKQVWLVEELLPNLIELNANENPINSYFRNYIENIFFISSLSELSKSTVEKLLIHFHEMIKKGKNNISIFGAFNLFLGIQYNLYQLQIPNSQLIEIFETLINKFIQNKFNFHEYMAFTRNELSNLYGYAENQKSILTNEKLIGRLINSISYYPTKDQMDITRGLLLNIYSISNERSKDVIKKYIKNINFKEEEETYKRIIFRLILSIYDFDEISDDLIEEIDDYLKEYKSSQKFSSALYMIKSQIEYLLEVKKKEKLTRLNTDLKAIIDRYEKSPNHSIF